MNGSIQNRDSFLDNIAANLKRSRRTGGVVKPQWKHAPQHEVYRSYSPDQLKKELENHCERIHTSYVETSSQHLPAVLEEAVANYGNGLVSTWDDPRFSEYGLNLLMEKWETSSSLHVWNSVKGDENITLAEQANVGITFSDLTLAESGTVVLFSSAEKGRAVSLLPATYIAIIPQSSIVPRMTQAAEMIHKKVERGETIASCINFITGPSNSADIEMNLVVGVHGPIQATYIVVNDR
ncbi:lactate utilization protein C [Priestia megaterium]|nr:lactate utilization protein C [Priestia megaterium]PFQ83681.1 lactate utilization protein C [Priestia megaterium]PFW49556.1 lactate utilization protein C [Priestia megaterium]PGR06566.1 lactate utilization protein C [Priestia megaterium]